MQLQKIVIAPDSFKESMTAQQVGNIIKQAFTNVYGNTLHYDIIPMADGGEGTTDALMHATGATKYTVIVNDPLSDLLKHVMHAQTNNKLQLLKWRQRQVWIY